MSDQNLVEMKDGDSVPFDSPVRFVVKGDKVPDGAKVSFTLELSSADGVFPDDAKLPQRIRLSPGVTAELKGNEAKGGDKKLHLNCDPKAHEKHSGDCPASGDHRKEYVPKYPDLDPTSEAAVRSPPHDIMKLACSEVFDKCAKMVKDHKIFYWWSDHAHFHAADTGDKMKKWVKYFLAPHAENGVDPESPGWKNVYGPLAPWSGYLHDLGMGANERLKKEIAYFDGLHGVELEQAAINGNARWKQLVDWLLANVMDPSDPSVPTLRDRAYRTVAKDLLANVKDGVRKRHSLNSTLYCVGSSNTVAGKLRGKFSENLLQKLALTVCMHSKSIYGPSGIDAGVLKSGYGDIKQNVTALKGGLNGFDEAGPGMRPWQPWLSKELRFRFKATVEGDARVDDSPIESPELKTTEEPYALVLARCIGVIDNMRERGNTGDFRDNQGVSFKKLPLDENELGRLNGPGPVRVQCGSFRLRDDLKSALSSKTTYLDVVRFLNAEVKPFKGLFGKIKDGPVSFQQAVAPKTLKAICTHPDNDVLVPPACWLFNLGELGIAKSELFAVKEAKYGQIKAEPDKVVHYVKIDTDRDPTAVAFILRDIVLEGPRGFQRGWVIAIDQLEGCKTPVGRWLAQGLWKARAKKRARPWDAEELIDHENPVDHHDADLLFGEWQQTWFPYDENIKGSETLKKLIVDLKAMITSLDVKVFGRGESSMWMPVSIDVLNSWETMIRDS
jgi:hypothetical protein